MQFETANTGFIFGREKVLQELRDRLNGDTSFLLHGASGVGKTFLIRHTIFDRPGVLYCYDTSSGHSAFHTLALELFLSRDRCVRRSLRTEHNIKHKSTIALRGIVLNALRENRYWIVLDHLRNPAANLSSDVRDIILCTGTPVVAIARSPHMEDLGFLAPMFVVRSDQMKVPLLGRLETAQFAEEIVRRKRLRATNLADFLERVVEFSQGSPGAVVEMLNMAAQSRYRIQGHIKTSPLYIDYRLAWHSANAW